jgi:hypothetical protein
MQKTIEDGLVDKIVYDFVGMGMFVLHDVIISTKSFVVCACFWGSPKQWVQ